MNLKRLISSKFDLHTVSSQKSLSGYYIDNPELFKTFSEAFLIGEGGKKRCRID